MSSFKSERELNTRFCANSPNAQYQINEDAKCTILLRRPNSHSILPK